MFDSVNRVRGDHEHRTRAGPQESYLGTLAQEADEPVPDDLTKAAASKKIDELQDRTGRGA